jgi:hypothetical protein
MASPDSSRKEKSLNSKPIHITTTKQFIDTYGELRECIEGKHFVIVNGNNISREKIISTAKKGIMTLVFFTNKRTALQIMNQIKLEDNLIKYHIAIYYIPRKLIKPYIEQTRKYMTSKDPEIWYAPAGFNRGIRNSEKKKSRKLSTGELITRALVRPTL